jgi:hypothetical protein
MHARISEHPLENLQKIVLTLTQYTAAKVTGDEIKIDNKMYDVAHLEYKGDTVIVYAQHDEDEDDLMAYFHSVLKRGHKDRKRVPGNLIKVLATQYLGSSFTIDFASPLSVQFDTAYLTYYSSLEFGKPTPPPRYC